MSSTPTTDITQLHQCILADLSAKFGTGWTVGFYQRDYARIPTPFINVELIAATPAAAGQQVSTEDGLLWQADLRFEALIIFDYKAADYRIKTRLHGAALAGYLTGRQWSGIANGPCRVLDSGADAWNDGGAAQYDLWRVEWEQTCLLAADAQVAGTLPSEIYLGFTPNTGPGHEAEYKRIA